MDEKLIPTDLTDEDINKMENLQETTLTDSDIANLETKSGNIHPLEGFLMKAIDAIKSIPGVQPFMNFNNQAAAGNREFVRNIGGREESYMKGFDNPKESSTFQKQLGGYADKILDNKFVNNMSPYPQAAVKTAVQFPFQLAGAAADVENNPVLGSALAAVKPVSKVIGNVSEGLFNPSKAYGKALEKPGKLDFLKIISKHEGDPVVQKVLNKAKIYDKYGGTTLGEGGSVTNKLENLNPKQAQNLINDVKLGKDALVSGKRIRPNEIGLAEFFSDLSKAQNEIPGMKGAKRMYGFSKNVGRFAKGAANRFIAGSEIGAGAKTAYDLLKK